MTSTSLFSRNPSISDLGGQIFACSRHDVCNHGTCGHPRHAYTNFGYNPLDCSCRDHRLT